MPAALPLAIVIASGIVYHLAQKASGAVISVTAILAAVGIIAFGEHLSAGRVVGLALAVAGAALIARD